jgi:hypothetical protein
MGDVIRVPARGNYDSAPLLLEVAPDMEGLFADPPVVQEPTPQNREYWDSADARMRLLGVVQGYLQHPQPVVRLRTLGLMAEHDAYFDDQLVFDLLAADPDEDVRRAAASTIWLFEGDEHCRFAVYKARDEIAYGSESDPVGPSRATNALALLVATAPDEEARKALEDEISLPSA